MSYSFGGKNTVAEFNHTATGVANCGAPADIDEAYRGDLTENSGACTVGGGQKKWAGLKQSEISYVGNSPFYSKYWAGIDCSGLVFRSMQTAKNNENIGSVITLPDVSGLGTAMYSITDDTAADWLNVTKIFDSQRVFYRSNPSDAKEQAKVQTMLRRGDLVGYTGHVSTVYSDRPTCDSDSCTYEIIHAYGITYYKYDRRNDEFSRKVTVTRQDIGTPKGFGRIKLWD